MSSQSGCVFLVAVGSTNKGVHYRSSMFGRSDKIFVAWSGITLLPGTTVDIQVRRERVSKMLEYGGVLVLLDVDGYGAT